MIQIKIIKLFIRFLKQNNAYEEFIYNFKQAKERRINFTQYLNCTNKIDYIFHAFPWKNTKSGFKKWNTLSNKWMEKLKIPHLFILFLKQKDVYEQYITNLIENSKKKWIGIKINSMEDVFNYYQPIDYINTYITTLHETNEITKWQTINKQWQSLLRKYNYDYN